MACEIIIFFVTINYLLAALYFVVVTAIAAYIGQRMMDRVIKLFGRASLIIFVLCFTVSVSTITLGESSFLFQFFNCIFLS